MSHSVSAVPADETLAVPTTVPPSRNVTVPVKTPPLPVVAVCATVAVSCSIAPAIAGFALAATVVAVDKACTVSVTLTETDARLLASPP